MSGYESLRAAGTSVICLSPVSSFASRWQRQCVFDFLCSLDVLFGTPCLDDLCALTPATSGGIRLRSHCHVCVFVIWRCTLSLLLPCVSWVLSARANG